MVVVGGGDVGDGPVDGQSGQVFLIFILSFGRPPTFSRSQDNVDLMHWSAVVLLKMTEPTL